MADEMNLGGMKVNRKMMMISAAAAAGLLGYMYYRRKQNPPTDTTSPSSSGSGTDPNIDPSTGVPYADEYGGGSQGYGGGYPAGYYPYYPSQSQGATPVTTNAQWAQAAETYLTSVGYDSAAVAAALGKGLTGQYLSNDQLAIFDAARAFQGEPPQSYPPLNTHPPGGGGGGGGGGGLSTAPGNLRATRTTKTSVTVTWSALTGATGYHLYRNGTYVGRTTATTGSVSGLSAHHTYNIGVKGYDSSGKFSPAATISVTTAR